MRIGCLQFAPQVGDVSNNISRAEAVLSRADPRDLENLDLLVLPEMALSGYNFKSREHILPHVEPTASGISSQWARTTAREYNCAVAVGYPETAGPQDSAVAEPELYNSLVMVDSRGERLAHYRKSFLYYTDETWAREGQGFYGGEISNLGKVAIGICMDINPYKFEAPWTDYEFASHVLRVQANLVILSTAWLTNEAQTAFLAHKEVPDMTTLAYWAARLEPIIQAGGSEETIVVIANRNGTEDDATYAGTSAVLGIRDGEVAVYGLLSRGEEKLLVVDTDRPPLGRLVREPLSRMNSSSPAEGGSGASPGPAGDSQEDEEPPRDPASSGKGPGCGPVDSPTLPSGFTPNQHTKTKAPEPGLAAITAAVDAHSSQTSRRVQLSPVQRATLPGRPKLSLQTNIPPVSLFLSEATSSSSSPTSVATPPATATTTAAEIPIIIDVSSPSSKPRRWTWESDVDEDCYDPGHGDGNNHNYTYRRETRHHGDHDLSWTQSQGLLSPRPHPLQPSAAAMDFLRASPGSQSQPSDRLMMLLSPWSASASASASPVGCRMEIPILASPSVFRSNGACW
ncbi:hypothetical protein VTJ83DRAFT_5657 [Remersonia thermophila]|uniref:CN hydrolase domain-containing protein n=1 Tax=Remersonia thermophila TaxID=72144 RepID=A0ABR4D7F0_9PEZI